MKKIIFILLFCFIAPVIYAQANYVGRKYFQFSDTTFEFGEIKILPKGGYCISPSAFSLSLDSIIRLLKNKPGLCIEIGSHTDSKGSAKYNLQLSQKRAHAFFDSLILRGADSTRLTYKGYGEDYPIVSNTNKNGTDCPECRAENRRMEIKIIQVIDAKHRKYFRFSDTTFTVGEIKILQNIYFNFDYAGLRPESFITLDSVVVFLKNNPTLCVEFSCHTDSRGNEIYNSKVSIARAFFLYQYVQSKGIDEKRLSSMGYGAALPFALNTNRDGSDCEECRQMNRRAELKITKILP